MEPLSRVPSYADEESTAFVVPIDPALPTYVDSEKMERSRSGELMERGRSETALVELGREVEEREGRRREAERAERERAEVERERREAEMVERVGEMDIGDVPLH